MKKTIFISFLFCFLILNSICCSSNQEKEKAPEDDLSGYIAANESSSTVQSGARSNYDDISNSRQNAITRAVEKISPAVVGINVTSVREVGIRDPFFEHFFGGYYRQLQQVQSLGSGFIISSDGFILTNEHVIHNAKDIVVTLTGGKKYHAEIVGSDVTTDVGLLKIDDANLAYTPLGNSDDVIIGEWAIAFGNPFGLFDIGAEPSVSVGVISATNRDFERQDDRVYQDMIQTDAAINSGNSGGPLVNSDGEVIGINTFIFSGSTTRGTSIGLGFAMPINRVKLILRELKDSGEVNRRFRTGLEVKQIGRLHARILGLTTRQGVIITDIEKNSPASRTRLEVGDVILKVNGYNINTTDDIFEVINRMDAKGGDELTLAVFRRGTQFEVSLELEKIP